MLLSYVMLALVCGAVVYCALTLAAARSYRAVRPRLNNLSPPVSVIKPLAGDDEGLEQNLRSFFQQEYPAFEILFAVRQDSDPAAPVVRKLQAEYPDVPSRLLITGDPPYANAKVFSLSRMWQEARYELRLMVDSDVRVTPRMLQVIAAEFADARVGLITCPYRAAPGSSFWSRLEALGINTEFLSGALVARMLNGMDFALGPAIAARREVVERIGGFDYLKDFLAEDFVMGNRAASMGCGVLFSSYVIDHRIGSQRLRANWRHRLRWARSTRRSRPAGYIGQVFTNPLPLAVLLWALRPHWWPFGAVAVAMRGAAAWATAGWILHDELTGALWWLLPLQDLLSFVVWVGGFFGNTILWRGRRYLLLPDGRFELKCDSRG